MQSRGENVVGRVAHKCCHERSSGPRRSCSYTRMRKSRTLFILYNPCLTNINCRGMTTDGAQIANLRVSYMHQRKQSQRWRKLWQSEERVEIGCSRTRLRSLNQRRIGETKPCHLGSVTSISGNKVMNTHCAVWLVRSQLVLMLS